MKNIALIITLLLSAFLNSHAQKFSIDPGVDLMSRYVWRGLNPGGPSPSIQPYIKFTKGKFVAGTWGAISTGNDFTLQETDLYVTYNPCDMISATITDYFVTDETAQNSHYFEFNEDSTAHLLEGAISFNGIEKFPVTFLAAFNFWGADARHTDHKKQYSSYFELGYKRLVNEVEFKAFIGGTATNPDSAKGETGFYAEESGITNIGISATKDIKVNDNFKIPAICSFVINPKCEHVYLVIGLSL